MLQARVILTIIEELREQMHRLAIYKGLSDLEVLAISQKLDCLLNDFISYTQNCE